MHEREVKSAARVANVLYGQGSDPILAEANWVLAQASSNEYFPSLELLEICKKGTDFRVIAKIITSATAIDPKRYSKQWTEGLLGVFSNKILGKEFVLGFALGIFQSAHWLDHHWRAETELVKKLPEIIAKLITWREEIINVDPDSWKLPSDYEGLLSSLIKSYFRPDEEVSFEAKEKRMAYALKITDDVFKEQEKFGGTKNILPELGEVILSAISFAIFGNIGSAFAQAETIHAFLNHHRNVLSSRIKEE